MKSLLVIIISIFCIFEVSYCLKMGNVQTKDQLKKDSLVSLFELAYVVREKPSFDSVSIMLRGKIKNEHECWIFVSDEIDTINRVISKSYDKRLFSDSSRPTELRNQLEVCVKNRDTILANLEVLELRDLKNIVRKFGYRGEEQETDSNVISSENEWNKRTVFKLSLDFTEVNGSLIPETKLYLKCLHEIMQELESVRNEQSMKKWGKPFKYLNFDQKIEIIDIIPYGIVLIFDSGCEELQLPSSENDEFLD